jgi:hypothetical protein
MVLVFNDIPYINWISPATGMHFSDTAHIPLTFALQDSIGGISTVSLFLNGERIRSSDAGSDTFLLDPLPAGSHELLLTAVDRYGSEGQSDLLTIAVDSMGTAVVPLSQTGAEVRAIPNPFTDHLRFKIFMEQPAAVTLKIFDLKGSLIFSKGPSMLLPGYSILEWDGQNNDNQGILPGTYICHLHFRYGDSVSFDRLKVIRE